MKIFPGGWGSWWKRMIWTVRLERYVVPICWIMVVATTADALWAAAHGRWLHAGVISILTVILVGLLRWDPPLIKWPDDDHDD